MGSSILWLFLAVPSLISFVFAWVFVVLLRRSVKLAAVFLALLVVEAVLVSLGTVYTFGGAFGPGVLLCALSPAAAAASLIVLLVKLRRFFRQFAGDRVRRWFYVGGGLTIAVLQLAPLFGARTVNGVCFSLHQREATPIIQAVEAYRRDRGGYPQDLEQLVPGYLSAIPSPPCSGLTPSENQYGLQECRSGTVLLTTESVDGAAIERYSFKTGRWSAISFLDGACSFLGE